MNEFHLGIIGRCMSLQPFMSLNNIYHRRLRVLLQEKERILLRVSLASHSHLEPRERFQLLFPKKRIDGILYHMRPIVGDQPLIYRKKSPSEKTRYFFNPLFFNLFQRNRFYSYQEGDVFGDCIKYRKTPNSVDIFDLPPQKEVENKQISYWKKEFRIQRKKWNLRIGRLCGLNRIFLDQEWFFFTRLQELCLEQQIPLFVLGPIPNVDMFEDLSKNRLIQYYNKIFSSELTRSGVSHYFLHSPFDDEGCSIFKRDRAHLNERGHAFLAQELYPILLPWITTHLRPSAHFGI